VHREQAAFDLTSRRAGHDQQQLVVGTKRGPPVGDDRPAVTHDHLACVTDVFSRMVIGWSMASHRTTDLVVDAVAMAVHRRGGHVPGVIHHSDRGGEYSSHALERELRRHRALASMGSVADCFDNALAESVFATLECELFHRQPGGRFATRREAKLAVLDYLETCYTPRRRHSALGQIAPATFEARHTLTTAA